MIDFLDRLQLLAVLFAHDDARLADGELEALATHRLDQDAELQFAAAGDLEGVLVLALGDLERHVAFRLAQEPVADDAALHLVAFLAGERSVVDAEGHGKRRRVDRLRGDRRLHGGVAERVGDARFLKPGDRDDVARLAEVDALALQAAEGEHLRDAEGLHRLALARQRLHGLPGLHRAGADAAGQQAARGMRRPRASSPACGTVPASMTGGATCSSTLSSERRDAVLRAVGRERHPALLGGAVEDRKVELRLVGVERGEKVEDGVQRDVGLRVGAVDLVDDDDGLQPDRERLHQHELRLRHRPFGRVDQQDRAVNHVQDALHLAAEIGVAGRVDDVDARVLPKERGHLGEDGDAALLLERVGIHGALGHLLAGTEGAGGAEKHVDQGRLAMIDMRDDGDVAKGRGHVNLPV